MKKYNWIIILGLGVLVLSAILFRRDFQGGVNKAAENCERIGGKLVMTTCISKDVILDNRPYSE